MIGINSNADLHLDHVTLKSIIIIYFVVVNTVTSVSYKQFTQKILSGLEIKTIFCEENYCSKTP